MLDDRLKRGAAWGSSLLQNIQLDQKGWQTV
jgi:hypothetical protein